MRLRSKFVVLIWSCSLAPALACGDSSGENDSGTDTDEDDDTTSGPSTTNPTASTTAPSTSTTMPPTTETTSGSTTEENTVLPPTISGPESTTEITTATTGDDMCEVPGPYVNDGGLEAGPDSGAWNESSTNFGTPICDEASCGTGGTGPHAGDYWAWFGGINATETGGLSQDVTIPTDGETLAFYLAIPESDMDGLDTFEVSVDGDVLFSVTDLDADDYPSYTRVELDITDYADGGDHTISFDSTTMGDVTNIMLDSIEVTCIPASTGDSSSSSGSSSGSSGGTDTMGTGSGTTAGTTAGSTTMNGG